MESLLKPVEVFKYFKEISAIPHGSGDMERISDYCMGFAKEHNLKAYSDDAKNVVIYKDGTKGYEDSKPIILQGHLDMVCQKTEDSHIDFSKDGLDLYVDGDLLKAKGTTLGADNGIAIAMIMAILADDEISHPPIEAVFTTDEEIGLVGAYALDLSKLKGKRMINIDSEEENVVTVSCAGGSDFSAYIPAEYETVSGRKYTIEIKGLKGGHSGVDINKHRVNADILLGRILNYISGIAHIRVVNINGGDKGNAIPNLAKAEIIADRDLSQVEEYINLVIGEISDREENARIDLVFNEEGEYSAFSKKCTEKLLFMLLMTPNGIMDMSASIKDLVETSLNLGVLTVDGDRIKLMYALRSNKKTSLDFLEDKLSAFASYMGIEYETGGRYEPWEYREVSEIRETYVKCFKEAFGYEPVVEAIHAGLECSVFSGAIEDFDCISVGPDMTGVHTVDERLSVPSVERIYNLILKVLKNCK